MQQTSETDAASAKKARMHETWTSATERYATRIEPQFSPLCEAMLAKISELASVEPRRCLDVAAGAGEPALTIAERLAGRGEVVGVDLCESMVELARERARERQLENCRFEVADAENLTAFEDESFDQVTCRQGIGFLPDPLRAMAEFYRVLRPLGILALTSWGRPERAILPRLSGRTAKNFFEIPSDGKGRPPSYWAQDDLLKQALEEVGFHAVNVAHIDVTLEYADIDALFDALQGTAMSAYFARARTDQLPTIRGHLRELASGYETGGRYALPCGFVMAVARKQ